MSIDFLAGVCGGVTGVVIGHPLDTIKVQLQTRVTRTWNIRALYAGIGAPVVGLGACNAIIFGVYGACTRGFDDVTLFHCTCAGATTGIAQTVVTCPMELVKTRAQISNTSVIVVARDVVTRDGMRALFRGWNATIARDAPAFATYFFTYEWMTRRREFSTWWTLVAGGTAGTASWLVVYPVDVIKTRVQTSRSSFVVVAREVFKERAMFRGLAPTLARAFPVNAATFYVVTCILRAHDYFYE